MESIKRKMQCKTNGAGRDERAGQMRGKERGRGQGRETEREIKMEGMTEWRG